MNQKYLGQFKLSYPISRCEEVLQINQSLILKCNQCVFEEKDFWNTQKDIQLSPYPLKAYLYTEDEKEIVEIYHFYQEIWSFLINYNYCKLKIIVNDIVNDQYIIVFTVYLLQKAFIGKEEQLYTQKQIKKLNYEEKLIVQNDIELKTIHQYAKESFLILFEILNLEITIKAYLRPLEETKILDDLLVQIYKTYNYYTLLYLSKNLQIPENLSHLLRKKVTVDNLSNLQQKLLSEIDHSNQQQIQKQTIDSNLFSLNDENSSNFKLCSQPIGFKDQLFDFQAQAVQWMLYREGRINSDDLSSQIQNLNLHKMWSQIKITDDNYIYFNEFNGQFSTTLIEANDIKGGILADQMGLGKSICALALILLTKQIPEITENPIKKVKTDIRKGHTLLIVQLSILEHWIQEIKKHINKNEIEYYEYYEINSRKSTTKLEVYDIVITTYGIMSKDFSMNGLLFQYEWERVILDEAHTIKSRSAICSKAASSLKAECRWCLTGTPIQNCLDDLYSLLNFLKIDTFSDYYWFNKYINNQENQEQKFQLLHSIIKPILLRRTKDNPNITHSLELPQKQHIVIQVKLSPAEQKFYDILFSKTKGVLSEYLGFDVKQREKKKLSNAHIFSILTLLRKCCDHPGLVAEALQKKITSQKEKKTENKLKKFFDNANFNIEKGIRNTIKQLEAKKTTILNRDAQNDDIENNESEYEEQDEQDEEDDEFIVKDQMEEENVNECQLEEEEIKQLENQFEKVKQIDRIIGQHQVQLTKIKEQNANPQNFQVQYNNIPEKIKSDNCPICLEPLQNHNNFIYLKCNHLFDSDCYQSWKTQNIQNNNQLSCPVCRREINQQSELKLHFSQKNQEPQLDKELMESSKINKVIEYILNVKMKNEKVVIFTQWLIIIKYIENQLNNQNITYRKLVGNMNKNKRNKSIQDFFQQDITAMIISLKAGAYGINLSCANHVLIVDPWWNPAVEDQAIERVHRLGQKKEVKILSFICEGTIEERVLELHKQKRKLFKDALHLQIPDQEFTFQDQLNFLLNQ